MSDHRPKTIDHSKKKRLLSSKFLMSLLLSSMVYGLSSNVCFSAEKNWIGSGDNVNWNDDPNWFPSSAPLPEDEVTVNTLDAAASVRQTFNAKSLSIGGNVTSSITVDPFVSGTVAPAQSTDIAVLNGVGGKLTLKDAAGTVTLRGTYKDSETPLSDEPVLVLYFG